MSTCTRCGATFSCAMADAVPGAAAAAPCWCTTLPPVVAVPGSDAAGAGCWCPDCLRKHIDAAAAAQPPAAPD